MSCPSWKWHRTGYLWSPVRTLAVAPLWCVLGFCSRTVVVIKLLRTSTLKLRSRSQRFEHKNTSILLKCNDESFRVIHTTGRKIGGSTPKRSGRAPSHNLRLEESPARRRQCVSIGGQAANLNYAITAFAPRSALKPRSALRARAALDPQVP